MIGEWSGTAEQLVTMASDAYSIIHALDPSAKIVGPSPSTANQYGVHFLPAYYSAGGARPQDIVGCHAYVYSGNNFARTPTGITTSISELQSLMAAYGIGDKPIWFTEGNWGDTNDSSLTDSQKVAYVAQEYLFIWSSDAVARYYWYSWDNARAFGTLWDSTKGIHPAGTAYGLLSGWLVGSIHPEHPCSQSADATWTCTLTLADGNPAEIVWNPNMSMELTVSKQFSEYLTLDSDSRNPLIGGEVRIGDQPILIK